MTQLDWTRIESALSDEGVAIVRGVLDPSHARSWARELAPGLRRLCAGEYEPLHRCPAAEDGVPLRVVVLLSEPGTDFDGGELVITERRPRMQTRPIVVPLGLGDAAILPTAGRPASGGRGVIDVKHGVSRVRSGERLTLELPFQPPRTLREPR